MEEEASRGEKGKGEVETQMEKESKATDRE